jgi:hypothetical protein
VKRFVAILGALALALAPALAGTFQPGFRGAPVAPVALSGTVYQVTASTFSPVTGAGGQAGDLMIVASYVWAQDGISASATVNTPSGWTAITSAGAFPGTNVSAGGLWYKYLNGTETASIGFWTTTGSSVTTYIQALRFTGGRGTISSVLTGQQWVSTNSSDTGTVASSGQQVSQLLVGLATRLGTTTSGIFTPTEDNVYAYGGTFNGKFYYRINNVTATTVRVQSSDSGNRQTISLAGALAL